MCKENEIEIIYSSHFKYEIEQAEGIEKVVESWVARTGVPMEGFITENNNLIIRPKKEKAQ